MPEGLNQQTGLYLKIHVPQELASLGIAPDLQRFVDAMIYKLVRNAHKGRWDEVSMPIAMERFDSEIQELIRQVQIGSTIETLMEAADVANMALIIAAISLEAKNVKGI